MYRFEQHCPVACAAEVVTEPWTLLVLRELLGGSERRVVVNLLDNATRHGKGLMRIGILRHDGQARIEVDDAGPGVPETAREHVFERFS